MKSFLKSFCVILLLIFLSPFLLPLFLLFIIFSPCLRLLIKPRKKLTELAENWKNSGKYIKWKSTLKINKNFKEHNIFTIQKGDKTKKAVVFIHGYPTCSFDFLELFNLLSDDYYCCAIDTIGYGLSDKPRNYKYSIEDDAKLVDYYIKDVLKLKKINLMTHDKGDSVGFALLGLYQSKENPDYVINHHIITNGGIYLPLANLSIFQNVLLSKFGKFITQFINGNLMTKGLNAKTRTVTQSKEKIDAMVSIIDYQEGGKLQHDIIQYLKQRICFENVWLNNLKNSDIPTTLIWGKNDKINPVAIADYVWKTSLKDRKYESHYWQISGANHYLQNDSPDVLSKLVKQALGESVHFSNTPEDKRPDKKY